MTSKHERGLKEEINKFIAERDYKNAGIKIVDNKLQKEYDIKTVLIPLYLQQRNDVLMCYIRDQPEILKQYIQFLDTCLSANCQLLQIVKHIGQAYVAHQQIEHGNVKKHLSKILNKFQLPISSCPNLLFARKVSAINFFINKKYKESSITEDSFNEMIEMILDSCPDLPIVLVRQLVRRKDFASALSWANKYRVPLNICPFPLRDYQRCNHPIPPFSIPRDPQQYLPLELNRCNIIMVETPRQFINALQVIQESSIVGVDEEWQPSLGITDTDPPLALLQLATRSRVFILDIVRLKPTLTKSHWLLLAHLFVNPDILKLAYHFENGDLSQLEGCSPVMSSMGKPKSVLDLKDFFEELQEHYPELAEEMGGNSSQVGLSRLAMAILGYPLDKREQKSNWEKRPLRPSLISYAALDAFCLIQIYDALQQRAHRFNLDFNAIVEQSLSKVLKSSSDSAQGACKA